MPEPATTNNSTDAPIGTAAGYGKKVLDQVLASLPVAAGEQAKTISAAIKQLNHLPAPRCEAWKYSPVNRLYEALAEHAESITASQAADSEELLALVDSSRYPLAAMAALSLQSATRVQAEQDQTIELPQPGPGHHWQHIEIPANVSATLIQRRAPAQGTLLITTVSLGEGASLNHALTGCPDAGTSWLLLSVSQQASSEYHLHQLSLGGKLERIDTHIRLLGQAARAALTGALLCGDKDRCDNQTVLEHFAADCTTTARYHGLANQTGKLTFGGRIHIHETGSGTDARLHNPNLLLSDSAEINTKPELEIYNDDVACAHGATVGQLDNDAVFYLRSRGINRASAYALMLRGFVEEALHGGPDAANAQQITAERLKHWTR